jgi:hypothetical protein
VPHREHTAEVLVDGGDILFVPHHHGIASAVAEHDEIYACSDEAMMATMCSGR